LTPPRRDAPASTRAAAASRARHSVAYLATEERIAGAGGVSRPRARARWCRGAAAEAASRAGPAERPSASRRRRSLRPLRRRAAAPGPQHSPSTRSGAQTPATRSKVTIGVSFVQGLLRRESTRRKRCSEGWGSKNKGRARQNRGLDLPLITSAARGSSATDGNSAPVLHTAAQTADLERTQEWQGERQRRGKWHVHKRACDGVGQAWRGCRAAPTAFNVSRRTHAERHAEGG
jgi:hypothetical protein